MTIERVGILGAGTMGRGITQACVLKGHPVVMCDISSEALSHAVAEIEKRLARAVEKAQIGADESREALARITTSTALADFADVELCIEAATEDPDLKFKLFGQLGEVCNENAIMASNTSSISLTRIAAASPSPQRVIGGALF